MTVESLQKSLPADAVLVDFLEYRHSRPDPNRRGKWIFERRFLGFVVRPKQALHMVELGPAEDIEAKIEGWRNDLRRGLEQEAGKVLRRMLWEPLEKEVQGAKLVLIGADGALGRLPLGALPGKKAGSYLLEEVAIVAASVPQVLVDLLDPERDVFKQRTPPSLLLIGDVDYDAKPSKSGAPTTAALAPQADSGGQRIHWNRLGGTTKEIDTLEKLFRKNFGSKGLVTLRDADATEEAFRSQSGKQRWLHLATHGFFAPSQVKSALALSTQNGRLEDADFFGRTGLVGFHPALLSGVVLAGANQTPQPGQDDGILTALEVGDLDLRKTELVVLSACETGLGQVAGGEGLLGLLRAFQVAGARTVIASLWSVPDEPTRVLMERFYTNLWDKKMSKLDALIEAQRWMLREGRSHLGVARGLKLDERPGLSDQGRLRPYCWAAFVLSGDWR